MSQAKGRRGAHHRLTGKYAKQFEKTIANKKRRHERHLSRHPNDKSGVKND